MTNKHFLTSIFTIGVFSAALAQGKVNYKVTNTFHLSGSGGWDYVAVNKGKLYLSHSTIVNILDEHTGDSIGVILNTEGVHGIAFDNALDKGYTSNGRANTVTVFDLNTNRVSSQIPVGENPDAIMYEPFSKMIITCNGRSNDLTFIDPFKGKVIKTVPVGGKPETAVANGEGKLYVNVEDKNEIVEVDLNTFNVLNHWSILPGEGPTGLAYDKKTNRLFAGCDKLLIILDARDGKVVSKQTIGDGCDGVAFNNNRGMVFTANGEGNITVVKVKSANEFNVVQTIPTKKGARTITIDEETNTLFLPTAIFEAPDPKAAPGARPKILPNTFQVLVVQ